MTNNTKDWIQYGSAIFMIVTGFVLSLLSFLMLHLIHSTVLIYLAQAVTFAGAVFGLSLYINTKIGEAITNLNKEHNKKQ